MALSNRKTCERNIFRCCLALNHDAADEQINEKQQQITMCKRYTQRKKHIQRICCVIAMRSTFFSIYDIYHQMLLGEMEFVAVLVWKNDSKEKQK